MPRRCVLCLRCASGFCRLALCSDLALSELGLDATLLMAPCIMGTVTVNILSNGFEQIWLLQNDLNKEVAEVLETYSYQVGLKEGRYSFATAVGMFQSLVGLIMIFGSNALSKRMGGGGLW